MAILNRFSAILLYCASTQSFASRCRISGDSRPAILGIVRFAIRACCAAKHLSDLQCWEGAALSASAPALHQSSGFYGEVLSRFLGRGCEEAAQCEIPPHIAQSRNPKNGIAEGGIVCVLPCFIGYRASVAEIPLL